MDGMQPSFFSTGNPQINFQFTLFVDGSDVAAYLFKSWATGDFQPQEPYSKFTTQEISITRNAIDEIPERVDDAQVAVGDSISTWGIATASPLKLSLNGFTFFDGLVEAERGCPPTTLSGTWTRVR